MQEVEFICCLRAEASAVAAGLYGGDDAERSGRSARGSGESSSYGLMRAIFPLGRGVAAGEIILVLKRPTGYGAEQIKRRFSLAEREAAGKMPPRECN